MSTRRWLMTTGAVGTLVALGTGGLWGRGRAKVEELPVLPPAPLVVPLTSDLDDLAWAQAINEDMTAERSRAVAAAFRQGHASPRSVEALLTTSKPGRFEVKLPSGAPITTPAVHGDLVLFSGGFHGKEFYAVDRRTGRAAWGVDLDDDGPSAPACADGVCVFNTESCTIFALDAATGKQRWAWWMGDPMLSAPSIAGGTVFTSYPLRSDTRPEATHAVAALDLQTGAVKWQRKLDGDIVSAPVAASDALYITTFSGSVFTLAQSDGALRAVVRGRATSAPTVTGQGVFWSNRSEASGAAREALVRADPQSGDRQQFADKSAPYLDAGVQSMSGYAKQNVSLDASNGFSGGAPATANAGKAMGNVGQSTVAGLQAFQGSRVASDGDNNFATMGDEVVCTDARTGEERWRHKVEGDLQAGGSLATAPALAGGKLVVGTLQGEVLILDPGTGGVERRLPIGRPVRSQPVVEDGWVYVGTEDGWLVGVDTGDPRMDGWAMWGGDAARTGAVSN
jgi:outer membrane protein assembly factor BamB